MDSVQRDVDASMEHDVPGRHPGALNETAVGNAAQFIRDTRTRVIGNRSGAGTISLPRPGAFDLRPPKQRYVRQHGSLARGIKRTFDVVGAMLILLVLAPVLLMIAFLIRADSSGSILFRQRRIGRDGRAFSMLKFRTMVDGADAHKSALLHLNEAAEGLFKITLDPRITRVGRWLRATSLDELPQLLHVITGKMSLVGPRPLVPEEDSRIIGSQRRRLQMRPGMTGVWQVGGGSTIPIQRMAELDRAYVEAWSPWLDVKVIARTVALVIRLGGR